MTPEELIAAGQALTPVEERHGRWYKREDRFAPFGPGGINGSKLRQLIHLLDGQRDATRVVTACSVLSPQGPMVALVARAFGIPATIIHGGTRPETALRHGNVQISAAAGADFRYIAVGYNPALQRAAREETARIPGAYLLCYGITTPPDASDESIAAFHAVGAAQVRNLPAQVKTLVVATGSANSTASILLGLAQHPPAGLERVVRICIGPDRERWLEERLAAIERATGETIPRPPTERHDLHGTGWATYGDRMPERADGIAFHPTYEGKVVRYLNRLAPDYWTRRDGSTCLWIVGSEPRPEALGAYLRRGRA